MTITLLITRPADGARRFAAGFADMGGVQVIVSPVVGIRSISAAAHLPADGLLILASRAAVQRAQEVFVGRRNSAYCIGAETARFATRSGIEVLGTAPTAAHLVAKMRNHPPGKPLLHLRGQHSTGAIAKHLSAAGIACDETVVYAQIPRELSLKAHEILQKPFPVIMPLFSRFAARSLGDQLPAMPIAPALVAISQGVADAWSGPSPRLTLIAESPDGAAMHRGVADAIVAVQRLEAGPGKS
ncbi:hypothetical protein ACMU_01555 [Actibacterium mucosum KCTC 23349]|uniref:Tetrapyrrole biosynthesis uroporphyrinogen III synthase domain-containing protein n=1 Tax=Actibacterium mucosum KCTC 23349 TaxID=1454373 RepID=A0A037ZL79_9RHOB|nr:uroporphyrinogen-III synthase [Actibacterium mucosum]KAJ57206.1 hypothetical protein ACMU_01555 [Actibacterium mucosum KCTC 23349]